MFDAPPFFRDVKLPAFWHIKPASWFPLAESGFQILGITSEQVQFDQLVGSLSKESIGWAFDLVENPLLFTPYTILKASLLEAHQLTPRCKAAFQAPCRYAGGLPSGTGDEYFLHTPVLLLPTRRALHHAGR